ncbi:MAG: cytochrome c peroxidase [Aggregatilineales bacterium]
MHRFSTGLFIALVFMAGVPIFAQDADPLYNLPNATSDPVFTDSSMAQLARNRLLITNRLQNTISRVDATTGTIEAEIEVGADPRSVTVTPSAALAAVLNTDDGTMSVIDLSENGVIGTYPVGEAPFAIITNNDDTAYISRHATHDILEIDLQTGVMLRQIKTPDYPSGMALWGDFLYVTHFWSGAFSMIYLPSGEVIRTIETGVQHGLSAAIELNPRAARAYLPQTIRNTSSNTPYDARQIAVLHTIDLNAMQPIPEERVLLPIAAQPVNFPVAAALNNTRDTLYISNLGSNNVIALDLDTRLATAIIEVGAAPQTIQFSQNNQLVRIHNTLDNSITEYGTAFLDIQDFFLTSSIPMDVPRMIGAQLFHDASDARLSQNNALSCATCHYNGQSDGLVRTGLNTPDLYDLASNAPYGWNGTWDSLDALSEHIRTMQAGDGLELNSLELDALKAYLTEFTAPRNPDFPDERLVQRGETVFMENGCAACHSGDIGTDGQIHDVSTGGTFVTPSLQHLWLTAPYLHDGSAQTLRDLFITGQGSHRLAINVPNSDVDALIAYLLQWD